MMHSKQTVDNAIEKFTLYNEELDKLWLEVESLEMRYHNKREVGIHKIFQTLIPSFRAIIAVANTDSIASLKTLNRMVLDTYSILYLLAIHSTERERNIRYYLFMIDGIKTRTSILENFNEKVSENLKDKDSTNRALTDDISTIDTFLKLIIQLNQDDYISKKIIDDSNWKFKNPNDHKNYKNYYNWPELYEIARIPKKYSYIFQTFYSSFTHGLGMTIMTQPENNKWLMKELAFEIASILISLTTKILLIQYEDHFKDKEINSEFVSIVNFHWKNWKNQ